MHSNLADNTYSPQEQKESLEELKKAIQHSKCSLHDWGFSNACSYIGRIVKYLADNDLYDGFIYELHGLMKLSSLNGDENLERDILDLIENEIKSLNEAIPPRP